MPPGVPTRPAGAGSIASAWGQWVHDWLQGRQSANGSGSLTCSTSYADVPGMSLTLPAGWYIAFATVHCAVSSSGVGDIDVALNVNGVDQSGTARWSPASTATGDATVAQCWIFQLTSTQVVKLRGKKSIAAGAGSIIGTNSRLMIV